MAAKKRRSSATEEIIHTEAEKYRSVSALNQEQKDLIKAIHQNDLVVISGLPGSGKSHICSGMAAEYLSRGLVDKIVLTRVCVGPENLGFLPGLLEDKIGPYLQPLLIELSNFLNVKQEISKGRIEILPIAYMRGRTLQNSFVILDEAENATTHQLKMFLTRIGENSKFVVNGDASQSDLDDRHKHDFANLIIKLPTIATPENKIKIVELKQSVRHPLVQIILTIFEE